MSRRTLIRTKRGGAKGTKGGDMTPEEQDEFNQMSHDAEERARQLVLAQEEANRIAQEAQERENELAEQVRNSQQLANEQEQASRLAREQEQVRRLALEQQLRTREAELSVQSQRARRADEMYDRLAYDRINSLVLGSVPLEYRLKLADRIAALARERLIAGRAEPLIVSELIELVRQLTETVKKVAHPSRPAPKKKSSKKKSSKKKSSKKKSSKKKSSKKKAKK